MKTRLLFATMVLPALFAACTNDEIVDSQSPSLDGRALLDPNFTITVNGEADTRFSWTEDGYKWNDFTANDKFSAGLLADANAANVLTNYVFSTKDGSAYTTTSQMVEGVYLFYSYPGFETNAKSEAVAFDLTSQVSTDLTKPADVVNAEKGQLFIAPLYQLEAETANNKLGLQFISYWSTAVIPVSNISAKPFKIARIVLRSTANDFLVKGTIDPSKMNTAGLIYKYDKDKGTYVLGKNGDKDAAYDDLRVADVAADGGQKVQELVVNCGSYELAAGKSVTAYIQVPAGAYAKGMEVEVVAEVTEVVAGKNVTSLKSLVKSAEPNYKSDDKLAANDQIRFRRSKSTSVFGKAADNTPNAYKVDDLELTVADAAEGLYASTYDEVYKYVTEAAADESTADNPITIYNQGSLTVDDNMMTLIGRVNTKHIQFLNPIEISSERASADLKNMQFAGGATIVKGAINFGAGVRLDADKELTIKEGATAKFGIDAAVGVAGAVDIAGTIKNEGTLQLAGAAIAGVNNVKDKKTVVEIVGNQTIGSNLANGVVATFDAPNTLKVAKDATLTIATTALTVGYGQTVEVAKGGTITATAILTNNGTIDNYGTISAVKNENLAPAANGAKKNAVINNYGTIKSLTNVASEEYGNGLVVMDSSAIIEATVGTGEDATKKGDIDNTKNGLIKANTAKCVVYAEFSGNKTGNFASNISECTKVVLKNGTWSEPALNAEVVALELDGVTLAKTDDEEIALATVEKLVMKNSGSKSALTFAGATDVDFSASTFEGNVTLSKTALAKLKLDYATFNGDLIASAVTSLTALDLIGATFNGALTANAALTTINVKPAKVGTKDVAATTSFGGAVSAEGLTNLNIAAKATMKMTNKSATIGVTQKTAVVNNGVVDNRGYVIGKNEGSSGTENDGVHWIGYNYEGADA